jgi:3-polyprenyl-4-hydroxybenzoate decarboxylase
MASAGQPDARTPWVVGVTGASGVAYATSVLRGLIDAGECVDLVVSKAGRLTMLPTCGTGPPVISQPVRRAGPTARAA